VGIVLEQIPSSAERHAGMPAPGSVSQSTRSLFGITPNFLDFTFLAPLGFLLGRTHGFQSLLGDGDTGWHIRTGDWMLQNGRIPVADFFSFSKPGGEWFAWEWLWDAAFSWLQKSGGMAAVLLVSALVICFSSALIYSITKSKASNALVSLAIAMMATCAASFHWLARPHLFTFIFVAIFYQFLDEGTVKVRRMMIGLPVLMVVWTNLHGGFVAGLLIAAAFVGGEFLRFLLTTGDIRSTARRNTLLYAKVFAACLAATFVNPYFYKLHQHVFSYLADGYQMKHIGEFQSINFHHPLAIFFEVVLILGSATAFWNLLRKNFTPVLLLAGWAHLSLVSGRNIPIFVIVASPLIAEAIVSWIADWGKSEIGWLRSLSTSISRLCSDVNVMEGIPRLHLVSGAAVWLIGSLLYVPAPAPRFQAEYDSATFPVAAVNEIQKRNLASRVFSTDDWSGYVIYRLYPKVRVFLDGRSDFYGAQLGDEYGDILAAKPGWDDHLKKYGVETILLPANSILSVAVKGSDRWRCIYQDDVAVVYHSTLSEPQVSAVLSNRNVRWHEQTTFQYRVASRRHSSGAGEAFYVRPARQSIRSAKVA
jgi:hypothetical protein